MNEEERRQTERKKCEPVMAEAIAQSLASRNIITDAQSELLIACLSDDSHPSHTHVRDFLLKYHQPSWILKQEDIQHMSEDEQCTLGMKEPNLATQQQLIVCLWRIVSASSGNRKEELEMHQKRAQFIWDEYTQRIRETAQRCADRDATIQKMSEEGEVVQQKLEIAERHLAQLQQVQRELHDQLELMMRRMVTNKHNQRSIRFDPVIDRVAEWDDEQILPLPQDDSVPEPFRTRNATHNLRLKHADMFIPFEHANSLTIPTPTQLAQQKKFMETIHVYYDIFEKSPWLAREAFFKQQEQHA